MDVSEQRKKFRLLIADDHPTVRSGIRALLEHAEDIEIVGEAADGGQAVDLAKQLAPDLILLDMEMPVIHGADVMRLVREANPAVQVLVLSSHNDPEYVRGMLASGALGYLLKEDAPKMLLRAIRGIREDRTQVWLSPQLQSQAPLPPVWEQELSWKELAMLQYLAEGKPEGEMAMAMQMTEQQCAVQLGLLMMKLEASSVEALREIARQMPPRS